MLVVGHAGRAAIRPRCSPRFGAIELDIVVDGHGAVAPGCAARPSWPPASRWAWPPSRAARSKPRSPRHRGAADEDAVLIAARSTSWRTDHRSLVDSARSLSDLPRPSSASRSPRMSLVTAEAGPSARVPAMDRTFVICKPDAVERGLVGEIIGRFERRACASSPSSCAAIDEATAGAALRRARRQGVLRRPVGLHHPRSRRGMVVEGPEDTWQVVRTMMGATNPRDAAPGTIRGDLGIEFTENLVHGSDSAESRRPRDRAVLPRALSSRRPGLQAGLRVRRPRRPATSATQTAEVSWWPLSAVGDRRVAVWSRLMTWHVRPHQRPDRDVAPAGSTSRTRPPASRRRHGRASARSLGMLGRDMAVDLGTANTLVYVRGEGIVLDEPSVVAVNTRDGRPLAVGIEAKRMIGRTPAHIQAIRPLKDGVIADFDICEKMLRYFIQKVHQRRFAKPRMVICVPSGITGVEQRAVQEAAEYAGRPQARLHHRRAHGRRHRRRPAGAGTDRQHDRRHRRWHHRGGGHLAGRRGRQPVGRVSAATSSTTPSSSSSRRNTASRWASAPPRRSRSRSGRPGRWKRSSTPRSAAATW